LGILLLSVVALSIALAGPVGAREPTRAQLPRMVVPDAALARLGSGLRHRFAFFTTATDAAASTTDPNDTAADLTRLGRIAGYIRGRNATGAFSRRAPKGLLGVSTTVSLWRDARAAGGAVDREIADGKRLTGRPVEGGVLISFAVTKELSLGAGAVLLHIHARPTGGTDRFVTEVVFRVGRLRGNVNVVRGGRRNADTAALHLAEQLRHRMLGALGRK
jgi:hypothetical protein